MPPGRSHKPLFEHLAKGLDESVPRRVATGDEISSSSPAHPRAGRVSMTWVALYGMVAGALLLAVGCWSVGYKVGYQAGEDAWLAEEQDANRVFPVDPLGNGGRLDVGGRPDDGASDGAASVPDDEDGSITPAVPIAGQGSGILSPRGEIDRDPRQDGFNYLELATLSRAQTESALVFLNSEGVSAIAVPVVESGRGSANNPARYRLVSIEVAIPGEQFRAMRTQRLDHERLIQRLGKEWQRERDGASDFAQPLWKRYP